MSLKNNLKYIATPSRIISTTIILLLIIHMIQTITYEIINEYDEDQQRKIEAKKRLQEQENPKGLNEAERKQGITRRTNKEFMLDGTALLVQRKNSNGRNANRPNGTEATTIYDKGSKLLWKGQYKDCPYKYLIWPQRIHDMGNMNRLDGYLMIAPELSRSFEIPVFQNNEIQTWRYNWEHQYFQGYAQGGEKIGCVGAEGFTNSNTKPISLGDMKEFTAWCPQKTKTPTLLFGTNQKIYEINFEKQKLELLFETTDSQIEYDRIAWLNWQSQTYAKDVEGIEYRPTIQFATNDHKRHMILKFPQEVVSIDIPKDWQYLYTQMAATNKGIFLVNRGSSRWIPREHIGSMEYIEKWRKEQEGKPIKLWVHFYKLNNASNLELISQHDWTQPPFATSTTPQAISLSKKIRKYINSTTPLGYRLPERLYKSLQSKISHDLRIEIDGFFQGLSLVYPRDTKLSQIISCLLMLLTLAHSWPRRTTRVRLIGWIIFTGAFNLAGFLTYLALNHTTVIKCPICKKRRGLHQNNCTRCQAELLAPTPRQTDLILHT